MSGPAYGGAPTVPGTTPYEEVLDLGELAGRDELLRQQLAQAAALRQGLGRQHTTGWGAALGGIGDVLQTGASLLGEGRAREAIAENQRAQARGRAAALQGLTAPDVSGILPEATPEERQQALADALLGRQRMIQTAAVSGDPVLGPYAQRLQQQEFARGERLGGQEFESGQAARKLASAEKLAATKKGEDLTKLGQDIRKEFMGLQPVKEAISLRVALDKLQRGAASSNAAGDMAMIFSYMKMLDPGSAVREGEYATARNAAGIPEQIKNLYNKALDGQFLTPDQRSSFVRLGQGLYTAQAAPALKLSREFGGYVQRAGLDPAEVLPDLGLAAPPPTPAETRTIGGKRYTKTAKGWVEE